MLGDAFDTVTGAPAAAYEQAINTIAPNLTDVLASNQQPGETWMDTLQRLLPTVVATYQQTELMQINLARARAGQPPIDMSAYSGLGVNVGLSAGTNQTVLMLGMGLIAAVVLSSAMKRRNA